MANAYKCISTVLNVIQAIFALLIASASIWFFIELKGLTDLRDRDRYLLDFNVYWPQILPWLYIVLSVFVICVSICGVYGMCAGSKSSIVTYVTFLSIVTLGALVVGILGLVYGHTKATDDFISESVSDAYSQMKVRKEVMAAFSNIETKLRCCGVKGSSDYTFVAVPESCCDKSELVQCENSASRRLGCADVAVPYTRMFIKYTSIGSLIIAVICMASLVVGVLVARSAKSKRDRLKAQAEKEPLKLPL